MLVPSTHHQRQASSALYLYPLNDSFVHEHIALHSQQRVQIGHQANAKTVPAERNGNFDSKVLSKLAEDLELNPFEPGSDTFVSTPHSLPTSTPSMTPSSPNTSPSIRSSACRSVAKRTRGLCQQNATAILIQRSSVSDSLGVSNPKPSS